MVLIANPGKIPDRTPGDFGCREDFDRKEFCFPSQIPATLPPRYPVARQESRQDSCQDPAEILAAGIPLPAKNPGKIPTGIPPRFWPPGIPSPAKNPGKIPAGIPPRFWPPGSRRDFGRRESRLPAKNPGKNPGGNRESRRPKSRRDPGGNLAGILGKIPPRSRYHFYKGHVYTLLLSSSAHLDDLRLVNGLQ